MKKIFSFFILTCILFSQVSAEVWWTITRSISEEEPVMCTMQYDPVCWVDWVTYGNSCSAWKVKIAYVWECNINSWVSEGSDWLTNDERLYNHIKTTLWEKYQSRVDNVLKNYTNRIAKFSKVKKQKVNTSVITALENEIFKITMKYPQDIALPESVNNAYLTITLLKMEIEKLNTK